MLPPQSPLFWAEHKDRFLRQLLIRDISELSGRVVIVYYTDCSTLAQIDANDDQYVLELIREIPADQPVDLILETNGGTTDGTEKLVALLRNINDLRVVVPRRAKSNGTLLALAAREIVMGPCSELGPIDPMINVVDGQPVPAQFIVAAASAGRELDPVLLETAKHAIAQTEKLAKSLLEVGMCSGAPEKVKKLVKQLATRDHYHSHGAVIDAHEAQDLGLNVKFVSYDDEYWNWVWLLRCALESDAITRGYAKIFEGARVSNAIRSA